MLTTKLIFAGELGILHSYINALRVLVAQVPAAIEDDDPTLIASLLQPDEGYVLAAHVSTTLAEANERSVLVQLNAEEFDLQRCNISVTLDYDTDAEQTTKFSAEVTFPELFEEIGLQLALFTAEYFRTGSRLQLEKLETLITNQVNALANTIPV